MTARRTEIKRGVRPAVMCVVLGAVIVSSGSGSVVS